MSSINCKLSPGQHHLIEALEPVLHLAISGLRSGMAVKPRTHTLIVGPSGSGKSFIVRELALRSKIPIWHENISNWSPMGARGSNPSFRSLIRWLGPVDKGIIFLDEMDKINVPGEFSNSIRNEVFCLLDHRAPDASLALSDMIEADNLDGKFSRSDQELMQKVMIEEKLRNHILIVAAGAWQSGWDRPRPLIGFHPDSSPPVSIGRNALLESIMPELLQRFRSKVLFLEPMQEEDYFNVMKAHLDLIPKIHRERYRVMALAAIPVAIEQGLGMRIFEEVYADFCTWLLQACCYDYYVFEDVLKKY